MFGLDPQSTQTGRWRNPHPFILRPFGPRRNHGIDPQKGRSGPCLTKIKGGGASVVKVSLARDDTLLLKAAMQHWRRERAFRPANSKMA